MEDNIQQHAPAKENGINANFPNILAMNYERPHYTTTSSSNNTITKYETNQDTKPKTEYLKSGTIERYKATKFTKKY